MLRLLRIEGESLSPEYQEGDFVVLTTSPFLLRHIKAGNVIVFTDAQYGTLIKRVERLEADGEMFVAGTHPLSLDSKRLGLVRPEAVIGKVVWHIRKPSAARGKIS